MDIDQLRTFVEVSALGSFAKYAEGHFITKTNAKHKVDSLETELGVALLERGWNGVAPTQAGEAMLARLRSLLPAIDDMVCEARGIGSAPAIRIAAAPHYAVPGIAEALDIANKTMGRDAELIVSPSSHHIADVLEGLCDIAFVSYSGYMCAEHEGLEFRSVGPIKIVAVVAQTHVLADRTSIGIDELANGAVGGGYDNIKRFPELSSTYKTIADDSDVYAQMRFVEEQGCIITPAFYQHTILCKHVVLTIDDPRAEDINGAVIRAGAPDWLRSYIDDIATRVDNGM